MTEEFDKLAQSLICAGIDPDLAPMVGKGIVLKLREWCWANFTDIVGTTADVGAIIHGPVKPAALAAMLLAAGVLAVDKGRFYVPSAWSHKPIYIDHRWHRASLDSYRLARLRNRKRRAAERGRKGSGTPGEKELRVYWCQQWSVIVGGGAPYPFEFVDAVCIRKLIEASKDIDHAKAIIDAYFQSRKDHWYAGKPLSKLVCDLPAGQAGETGDGH